MMSHPDSVGELSDKRVKQVTDPRDLPVDETGQAEGVVEGGTGQTVFYSVDSVPPIYLMILFGLQQALMTLGGTLSLPFILASLFCPENENEVRAQFLSITMFMCGIATILQCALGVRLPIIQGGSHTFVAPIVVMMTLDQFKCPTDESPG